MIGRRVDYLGTCERTGPSQSPRELARFPGVPALVGLAVRGSEAFAPAGPRVRQKAARGDVVLRVAAFPFSAVRALVPLPPRRALIGHEATRL